METYNYIPLAIIISITVTGLVLIFACRNWIDIDIRGVLEIFIIGIVGVFGFGMFGNLATNYKTTKKVDT